MGEANSFISWLSSGGAAIWLGFFMLLGWMVRTWPVWKQRVTEAKAGADTIAGNQMARLVGEIGRLAQRVESLEASEERCRTDLADAKMRIAELEGYNMGRGEARNEAQRMLSNERETDRHGKGGK
jgi:hypothetical protein